MNLDYLQICIAFISCCQSIKDLAEVRGARQDLITFGAARSAVSHMSFEFGLLLSGITITSMAARKRLLIISEFLLVFYEDFLCVATRTLLVAED